MQARTRAQRNHQARQWGEVYEMMKSMKEQFESASPLEQQQLEWLSPPPPPGPSFRFDDVKKIVEQPMVALLGPIISAVAPALMELDMGLIETADPQGFITSDNPCAWYDSELLRVHPFYRDPSLASPTIEVILPITPKCQLLFNRREFNSRFVVPENVVDFYNRLTRHHADEFFITNRNEVKPFWFTEEPLPEYAWENR